MEHEMKPYIVYVKADEQGRITAVNSSAFLLDTDGWTEIDSGYGDKYHHAQGNYLPDALWDEYGIPNFKLVDGKAVERTQAERDADYVPQEEKPSDAERITALEEKLRAAEILLGIEE